MAIACAYTIKEEGDFLLANLDYHRFLGVDLFLIFLDGSSASTRAMLEPCPDCILCGPGDVDHVEPICRNRPELDGTSIARHFGERLGLRQTIHANAALDRCRKQGIDWLFYLDPDELVYLGGARPERGMLQSLLLSIPRRTDVAMFRNLEVIPDRMHLDHPFENLLFKRPFRRPKGVTLPRELVRSPLDMRVVEAGWYWGHNSGKIAIRVASNAYFITPHRADSASVVEEAGRLLHYYIADCGHFLSKYRNFGYYLAYHRNSRILRPIRFLLSEVANSDLLSDEDKRMFYRSQIMYSDEDLDRIRVQFPEAVENISAVSDFFRERHRTAPPRRCGP